MAMELRSEDVDWLACELRVADVVLLLTLKLALEEVAAAKDPPPSSPPPPPECINTTTQTCLNSG